MKVLVMDFAVAFLLTFARAAAENERTMRFLALGDWGSYDEFQNSFSFICEPTGKSASTSKVALDDDDLHLRRWAAAAEPSVNQKAIARAMSLFVNNSSIQQRPQCVLALGDNFYTKGVYSVSDPSWEALWRSVYLSFGPSLRIPWHPVCDIII
jgi:hypothetical protein